MEQQLEGVGDAARIFLHATRNKNGADDTVDDANAGDRRSDAHSSYDAVQRQLRVSYAKRKLPFILLTREDEREQRVTASLTDSEKEKRSNLKSVFSIERLNTVMEPAFDKLYMNALTEMEARHATLRLEAKRLREKLATSEEAALEKAAKLERRRSRTGSVYSVGPDAAFPTGDNKASLRRRSTIAIAPLVGLEGFAPTALMHSTDDSKSFSRGQGSRLSRNSVVLSPSPEASSVIAPRSTRGNQDFFVAVDDTSSKVLFSRAAPGVNTPSAMALNQSLGAPAPPQRRFSHVTIVPSS